MKAVESPLVAAGSDPSGSEPELLDQLAQRLASVRPILVVSPPRSVSTAFAQSLIQHSAVPSYCHEPCGLYSYENTSLQSVLDLLDGLPPNSLIKEMTFQFRELSVAECFFRHCVSPTIFLARSPLLTIESRIRRVLVDLIEDPSTTENDRRRARAAIDAKDYSELDDLLDDEVFPLARTGWSDFEQQVDLCRRLGLDYRVVETTRFRADPEAVLRDLCPRLGLEFEPGMLHWEARSALPPGALGRHAAWYARVGESTGVQPPVEKTLSADRFPTRFRDHLPAALETYDRLVAELDR